MLRCTHREGWEFVAQPGERAVQQLSYWVQVRTNGRAVSDSEVVTSNVLFLVKYAGPALASGMLVSTLGDDAMATAVVQFAANHVQNRLTVRYCTVALNAGSQCRFSQ